MPEVQTSQHSGEMTQRFISFLMMHAQQAGLFLGQIPHPQTGKPEKNLDAAKLFIDQLEMIQEKTRNNLSSEESGLLAGILSDLQMAFVKVSAEEASAPAATTPSSPPPAQDAVSTESGTSDTPTDGGQDREEETASRKKFSKSYGA